VEGFNLADVRGVEGPECYVVRPAIGDKPALWCLILDHYARGAGYKPYLTDSLAGGRFEPTDEMSFPFPFRHGCVVPISPDQYASLKKAYPSEPKK
jgi:hypothetical protein